ncbi:hypothetical protein G9A89_023624 [Geosiphon pyriformis]|nr:hypothetical protein G9A89_023624 [Geosiphon pyriformis]
MEFKIGNQVLLHRTKAEKQWSRKFDPKWNDPFHIHKALGNRAYKLQLEDKILKKVTHKNQQCWRKNCLWIEGEEERGKEQEKDYKRRYLVPKLKEIKEALARETNVTGKLGRYGKW